MATKRSAKLSGKAQALLDAQVGFWLDLLEPAALKPWVAAELDAVLADAKKLKLEEVVSRKSVQHVALRYAAEVEHSGAIPELVGEIAKVVQAHPLNASTKLSQLIPDRHFVEWLNKLLELKDARNQLLHEALRNPVMNTVAGDLLYRGISGYLGQSNIAKGIPGAQSMLKFGKSVLARATPRLEGAIEETLRRYIQQSLEATLRESEGSLKSLLTDKVLRDAALEIWAGLKGRSVAEFRASVSNDDVEELFVIGYEHWRDLRKTKYYAALIETGVAAFFDKYGKTTLAELLEEVGVSRDMILHDLMEFAPAALAGIKKKKLLEPLVRRLLAPFYASAAAQKILGD